MSEAELYVLRARLQGGILNKARRAALKLHLPVGFCYAEDDRIILDPDRQVQDPIRFLFRTFQRTGSASATVRAFRRDRVPFPRRVRSGPHQGALVRGDLQHHDVLRLLHNPCYAGAFAFGRTRTAKTVDGTTRITSVPREPWPVVVRDAHVGSIAWEAYERHLTQLTANRQAYTPQRLRPPREGPALLQGLVLCGRCGERMTVRDHQRRGQRIVPDYLCQRAGIARGEPPCQRVPGRDLDRAMANVLVEVVTPEAVALTLAVQAELVAQAAEAARLRQLQVERAQYEAVLAQRRSRRVDPENRLVAAVLEAEWNAKRRALAEAQEAADRQCHQDQIRLSATERETMLALPPELTRFWHARRTTERERKRVVRLLIEDVTVQKADHILAQLRFKGGATRTLTVPLPPPFMRSRFTPAETLAAVDQLLDTDTEAEVAAQLNARGYRPFTGLPFQALHVSQLRRAHGLKDRLTRLRDAGMRTAAEVAARLGVSELTSWRWYHRGWRTGARDHDRGTCVFVPPEIIPPCSRRQRVGTLNRS
jgi:Recombinase zinc beta ribbon domain/Recombinase